MLPLWPFPAGILQVLQGLPVTASLSPMLGKVGRGQPCHADALAKNFSTNGTRLTP